jgi:NAD(P)-dependent dehydrogenase (short-subunit alcohol dehydrogenase family)
VKRRPDVIDARVKGEYMKIVVITGGNRGVGTSSAINAAKRGVGVILSYNSHAEEAEPVVSEIE